jgi:hypothetical protein
MGVFDEETPKILVNFVIGSDALPAPKKKPTIPVLAEP